MLGQEGQQGQQQPPQQLHGGSGGMKDENMGTNNQPMGGMASAPEQAIDPIMNQSPFNQPHWQATPETQGHNGASGPLASGSSTFPHMSGNMPGMGGGHGLIGQSPGASKMPM